jgi:hypothetical protein
MDCTRRQFWRRLASEAVGWVEAARGKPRLRLGDIEKFPDDRIGRIVPVLKTGGAFRISGNRIVFTDEKSGTLKNVYRFDPVEIEILGWFDGRRSLSRIGPMIDDRLVDNLEMACRRTKELFFLLAGHGLCEPLDP